MKALVTGASGFIGSAVVRRLLDEGMAVRVLVRQKEVPLNLKGLSVERVTGDIRDPLVRKQALRGCGALFHMAADYRLWVPNPETMYRTNVEATRGIVMEAAAAGLERIVYCSSVAVLGHEKQRKPANEDTPSAVDQMVGHYKRSKFLAEESVRDLIEENEAPVVIINPTAPVGPGDVKPTPTGRMVLDAFCGRMPAYVNTGLNLVHVDDVAQGAWLAFTKGEIGERYILGGENVRMRELLRMVARLAGRTAPLIRLSTRMLYPLALVMEGLAHRSGKEPLIHREVLRMAHRPMFFSSQKARDLLGYTSRPAETAIADAVQWFERNGYTNPVS